MRRHLFGALTLLTLAALAVLGWAGGSLRAQQSSQTIVLGAALSLTGEYADNGAAMRDGYRFAIETINAHGGVVVSGQTYKLALTYSDDDSMPGKSAIAVEHLIRDEGVKFLLGPFSTQLSQAVQPVAETYDVPLVDSNGSGSSLFQRGYHDLFAVLSPTDGFFSDLFDLAEQQAPKLGKKPRDIKVAMAFHSDGFSQSLRVDALHNIARRGMQLVIDDRLPLSTTHLSMMLNRIKMLQPDVVIVSGHDEAAIASLKQIAAAHIRAPILAITHCDSAHVVERLGAKAEDVFCPMQWVPAVPYHDDLFGSAQDFANAFEKAFGYVPSYQSAQSAAAVEVYADAFSRAGNLDPKTVRDQLARTDLETFYGPIKFDSAGRNMAKKMLLTEIIHGHEKIILPPVFASAAPVLRLDGR